MENPGDAEKLAAQSFFRGLQALKDGELGPAEAAFRDALRLAPGRPSVLTNLSIVLTRQGRLDEALVEAEAARRQEPDNPLHGLQAGAVLLALGRNGEALAVLDAARAAGETIAELHYHRATALRRLGRTDEALAGFERAIALRADYGEAHAGRAAALLDLDRAEEALAGYERAIAAGSGRAETYAGMGRALRRLGRATAALERYDRAIALDPAQPETYTSRGNALEDLQRYDEALADHDRAIALNPAFAEAHSNRGNVLMELGRLDEAAASFATAKAMRPDFDSALWNEANLLLQGKLEQGFRQYEFRRSRVAGARRRGRHRPQPTPDDTLAGKRLLIWSELFLGDAIQFCRYARVAAARGAEVTVAAPRKLHRLLATLGPDIAIADEDVSDAGFDYQLPLMSCPLALQRPGEGFPAEVPYLHAEPERVARWRQRIGTQGLKIGICWQGSKLAERDGRSFPLREFHALSGLSGVRLISLQKFDGVEQLRDMPPGMRVEELGDAFDAGSDAFLDSAAVIDCLDLVITCDTSIAHLAGALGRPTWVLLKRVPEWRWSLDRQDSPWYPQMRLFRQQTVGAWGDVFARVAMALEEEFGR